jgi:hypothetical protein
MLDYLSKKKHISDNLTQVERIAYERPATGKSSRSLCPRQMTVFVMPMGFTRGRALKDASHAGIFKEM